MAVTAGQIVAMGGGAMDPKNHLLEDFVVSLIASPRERPRVCFVPTASGDADSNIVRFYNAFPSDTYQPSHLTLFNRRVSDLESFLHQQDVIYVGGGNTANMLAIWRIHGVDRILREALTAGVVLCGSSAGALCWFEDGVTDSYGGHAQLTDGLGFLDGNFTPHWDSESERQAL
ncbi:MAG TPA: peptidase E, partial [Thermomicrobiaceae bacterium]|nr:peptidase E [Thermomicrobiaceae bacterium]